MAPKLNHRLLPNESSTSSPRSAIDIIEMDYDGDIHGLHNPVDRRQASVPTTSSDNGTHILAIFTGTLGLLHCGLVSSSYFLTWSDTVLRFNNDGSDQFGMIHPEITLKENDLWFDIDMFRQSGAHLAVAVMITTAVIIPICNMIIHSLLVYWTYYKSSTLQRKLITGRCGHCVDGFGITFLEILSKTTLAVIFVQGLLLLSTSVHFQFGSAYGGIHAFVRTWIGSGIAAFLVGVNAGIALLVFIRVQENRFDDGTGNSGKKLERKNSLNCSGDENENENLLQNEIHNGTLSPLFHEEPKSPTLTLTRDSEIRYASNTAPSSTTKEYFCQFLQNLFLYESGGIATLLCPLSFFTSPIFSLEYSGFAAMFIYDGTVQPISSSQAPTVSIEMTLVQTALELWQHSKGSQYAFLVTALFWITVIILPITCLCICLVLQVFRPKNKTGCSFLCQLLRYIFSFANLTVFAVCIFFTMTRLEDISVYLFDGGAFCDSIGKIVEIDQATQCLVIRGTVMNGGWYCLIQGLSLDVFVYMTLAQFGGR